MNTKTIFQILFISGILYTLSDPIFAENPTELKTFTVQATGSGKSCGQAKEAAVNRENESSLTNLCLKQNAILSDFEDSPCTDSNGTFTVTLAGTCWENGRSSNETDIIDGDGQTCEEAAKYLVENQIHCYSGIIRSFQIVACEGSDELKTAYVKFNCGWGQ